MIEYWFNGDPEVESKIYNGESLYTINNGNIVEITLNDIGHGDYIGLVRLFNTKEDAEKFLVRGKNG